MLLVYLECLHRGCALAIFISMPIAEVKQVLTSAIAHSVEVLLSQQFTVI